MDIMPAGLRAAKIRCCPASRYSCFSGWAPERALDKNVFEAVQRMIAVFDSTEFATRGCFFRPGCVFDFEAEGRNPRRDVYSLVLKILPSYLCSVLGWGSLR